MNNLNKFDDFIIDSILESVFNKEMDFYMSDNLIQLINSIVHPISNELLSDASLKNKKKCTFIDLDLSSTDAISFLTPSKAAELMTNKKNIDIDSDLDSDFITSYYSHNKNDIYKDKKRSVTTIGKLISKLYGKKFPVSGSDNSIESFVDMFKSTREKSMNIEEVKGEDIKTYYLSENYLDDGGTLNNSCMRYDKCQKYIDFYAKNQDKVSLLILRDIDNPKLIKGRALLWKLDKPSNRYFMDRIYTVNQHDVMLFIDYAIKNNYLYKNKQNSSETEKIVDPKINESDYLTLCVYNFNDNSFYPYMDTLKYYDIDDKTLTNEDYSDNNYNIYRLENTDGGYEHLNNNRIYVEYYGEYYDEDDLIYCDYGDEYRTENDAIYIDYYDRFATEEFINSNMDCCDYYDTDSPYRFERDTVRLINGEIASEDYDGIVYSDYKNEYILDKDAIYSDHHNTDLYRPEAREVFTDVDLSSTDWRDDDDDTWWTWDYDGNDYDKSITEEMLREFNELDDNEDDNEQ